MINYQGTIEDLEKQLNTSIKDGLSTSEVMNRQKREGKNELITKKPKNFIQKFIEQIGDFMILTLLGAAIVSFILGESKEGILIIAIVVINALFGIIQENKAEKSLEAIKKMTSPHTKVLRDGKVSIIHASDIVVGDIILLEAGDYVPADARIIELQGLKVDESALTGESIAVEKSLKPITKDQVSLGDLTNCVFSGTTVTYGRGKALVTDIGMNTQIGKIAKMINEVGYIQTPIQKSLEKLGKILLVIIFIICLIIFYIGVKQKQNILSLFINCVSLAVAAIPEGLPAIVTIVLAIGMQRMAKKKALIRKLPAVETLGSTNIICTDKTGTLTQNKMTVTKVYTNFQIVELTNKITESMKQLASWSLLCTNTKFLEDKKIIGDPTEVALVNFGIKANIDPINMHKLYERKGEIPFSSERKLMTTVHKYNNKTIAISKGAPEVILKLCKYVMLDNIVLPMTKKYLDKINEANEQMSKEALRIIGVAIKMTEENTIVNLEQDLAFVGLIGMIDPPREEVYQSIQKCLASGIDVVMITGDHINTAIAIAKQLQIIDEEHKAISGSELDQLSDKELKKVIDKYRVYARVNPEHKVRIVKAWKSKGKIVAMTGDGVNDAPALKNADIGIAMGIQGTEVAKGASDMILTDDNFATIVSAVEEGRTIFANIKKAIKFLLSCNIGEIVTVLLGSILGAKLFGVSITPLTAVQLLWVNLTTDSLISIAIGLEKSEPDIMKAKSKKDSFLDFESLLIILGHGILFGLLTFMAFNIGYKMGVSSNTSLILAQTMAFMTLTTVELFHAFNVRSERYSIFKLGLFSNKYLIIAFVISMVLQYGILLFPFTRSLFNITTLSNKQLLIIFGLSLIPIIVNEIGKLFSKEDNKIMTKENKYLDFNRKQKERPLY